MFRILIIGRKAGQLAQALEASTAWALEIDTARLPAAGVRQMEAFPPDIIILQVQTTVRTLSLAIGIKKRPMGELIPVVVVGEDDASDNAPGREFIDSWLPLSITPRELLKELASLLELDDAELETSEQPRGLEESTAPSPSEVSEVSEARASPVVAAPVVAAPEAEYEIEIIEDENEDFDETRGPTSISRREIFGDRTTAPTSDAIDEAGLRRKLRAIRHEDYFAILEVPRGVETPAAKQAYSRLKQRFSKDTLDYDLIHRYHAELEEIRDALEDAWAVLGDASLRGSYLDQTTRS